MDKESDHIKTFLDNAIPILVPSTSANVLKPASDTQRNNNTSSESNPKAPQKRRANVLEVNMDDKKHPDMLEKNKNVMLTGCPVLQLRCTAGWELPFLQGVLCTEPQKWC